MTVQRETSVSLEEIASLKDQIEELTQRADEAEEALDAIRHGTVDALVVYSEEGDQIYSIQGAESTYRLLVESINEGAATLIEDGTILYCNRRFADMLKYPMETLIGSSIRQYIAPEHQGMFSSLLLLGLNRNCRDEVSMLCKDGSALPVMASLSSYSAVGGSGVCLIATDITERKQVEEANRLSALRAEKHSEFSKALVASSLDEAAIIDTTAHFAPQLVGGMCFVRLLTPDHQAFGTTAHFHPDPEIDRFIDISLTSSTTQVDHGYSARVLQTGEALILNSINPTYVRKIVKAEFPAWDKHLKVSSLIIVPLSTHNQIVGTLTMVRLANEQLYTHQDLNMVQRVANQTGLAIGNARLYGDLQEVLKREKSMQRQLIQAEKLSAMSRMMATVVHEINNPVQTIKNCIYLALLDAPADSPISDSLDTASSEINRIGKLVASLRDVYRQPSHSPNETVELSQTLSDVHLLMYAHLQYNNVIWQQEACDEELWVKAAADHLKQVFLNICLNALEAMQPDGGTITVSLNVNESTNEAGVTFKDTGSGIEPENLDKVFEPFFTTKENGSGLGLPICYEIVQTYGGHIQVESQPGCGTAFTIWFPRSSPQIIA